MYFIFNDIYSCLSFVVIGVKCFVPFMFYSTFQCYNNFYFPLYVHIFWQCCFIFHCCYDKFFTSLILFVRWNNVFMNTRFSKQRSYPNKGVGSTPIFFNILHYKIISSIHYVHETWNVSSNFNLTTKIKCEKNKNQRKNYIN